MAINRNAYMSLIESVQEAASAPSASTSSTSGKGRIRSSGGSSVTDIMQGISNGTIQWGDSSIGGAMNASELSQWLAGQMGSGKPSVTPSMGLDTAGPVASNFSTSTGGGKGRTPSGKPGVSTSAGAESGVVGSRGRNPMTNTSTSSSGPRKTPSNFDMAIGAPETSSSSTTSTTSSKSSSGKTSKKPSTKSRTVFGTAGGATSRSGGAASRASAARTVADSVDLSDLIDALTIIDEANRPYIPPNLSGSALSHYLNSLSGPNVGAEDGGVSGSRANSTASRLTSTRRRYGKRPTISTGGGINTTGGVGGGFGGGGVSSVGLGEDFDILDEILAEGLELYGEDGLAEILADFAETGEMSHELADLLGEE
jgi:hypothetical protein